MEDGDAGAEEPVENQASDHDGGDSIIDETLDISAAKDRTRSKSEKYNIPTVIIRSYSEERII